MPSGQVTVTARSGPAVQSTAAVFTNVTAFDVDIARQVIFIRRTNDAGFKQYDLSTVTTVTATLVGAGGNWTVALS